MQNIILRKANGKLLARDIKLERDSGVSKIKCFDFLANQEYEKEDILDTKQALEDIRAIIKDADIMLEKLYNKLALVNSMEEAIEFVYTYIDSYTSCRNKYDKTNMNLKMVKKICDKTINYAIEKIAMDVIEDYYSSKIGNRGMRTIHKYAMMLEDSSLNSNITMNNIMAELKIDINKDSNFYIISRRTLKEKILLKENIYELEKGKRHLCRDCYAPICECDKMLDDEKRMINEYDFITDGVQVIGIPEDGETEAKTKRLTVYGCTLYDKYRKRK